MLTEPLPSTLDVRKAAVRGARVSGVLKPLDLQRFRSLLASDEGRIEVVMDFSKDEEGRYLVHVVVDADVRVTCQRCLGEMPKQVSSDSTLAVVLSDAQAASLPRHLEPLLMEDPNCALWPLVEEELILALPPFSYHDPEDCNETLAAFNTPPPVEPEEERPNPFDVLAQLKGGKNNQE